MPRRPGLGYEDQRMAERVLMEILTTAKSWSEGQEAFIDLMRRRMNVATDSDQWPKTRERLQGAYPGLHKKAERSEWVESVKGGWRSTAAGLAHAQERPLAPGEWKTHDLHDVALKGFLRNVSGNLKSLGLVPLDPWISGEVPEPHGIERFRLFGDLAFHFRLMGVADDENPVTAYRRTRGLAQECNRTWLEVRGRLETLLRKSHRGWTGNRPLSLGPIAALRTFLEEGAGSSSGARGQFAAPALVGNEIRVAGSFTLFAGPRAAKELPRIQKAWSRACGEANRGALRGRYLRMRRLRAGFWESLTKCRASIDEALAYPHFPGICTFRQRAQEPRRPQPTSRSLVADTGITPSPE